MNRSEGRAISSAERRIARSLLSASRNSENLMLEEPA
jgi:hypothetical protein